MNRREEFRRELQEKCDWLEEKGFAKVEDEYILRGGHYMRFHEETVLSAPLGALKASYNRHIESVVKELTAPKRKEVEVELHDRETFYLRRSNIVYIKATVTVKEFGKVTYKLDGEFSFEDHPKGDMKYYEEVIRGSFL